MSYLEYRVRLAWLDEQWKHPDMTQHYLMQIAHEVNKVPWAFTDKSYPHNHEKFRLQFTTGNETKSSQPSKPAGLTQEQLDRAKQIRNEMAKQMVMARLGIKPGMVRIVQG
jgi:hypothetical protein